jgi:dinuclear metal center YbgI/SA1388 family protein
MLVQNIIDFLEVLAPPALQEDYDNCGLLIGNAQQKCKGILVCLDVTEAVVDEAIAAKANLIIAHHPLIFGGLKKITGGNAVERTVALALKKDIAVYAIHTNIDNVLGGVNAKMADQLGLLKRTVLSPKPNMLKKLYSYAPPEYVE